MRRLTGTLVLALVVPALTLGGSPATAAAGPVCDPLDLGDVHAGAAATGQLTCDDPSGSGLSFAVDDPPASGMADVDPAGFVTYYSDPAHLGPDPFGVTVSDNAGGSVVVPVSVSVVNQRPVCAALHLPDVQPGGSVSGTASCSDGDADPLTFRLVTQPDPAQGTASLSGSLITFTATPTATGTQTFTFAAGDGAEESDPQQVTVSVAGTNHAPACGPVTAQSQGGQVDVQLVCSDSDGDPLVLSVVDPPATGAGSVGPIDQQARSVRFTPAAGFAGSAVFTYRATDQHAAASNPATATIAVQPPATVPPPVVPPVATGDSAACTKARLKLAASRKHLKALRHAHASQQQIAKAKKRVKKARQLVAAACG